LNPVVRRFVLVNETTSNLVGLFRLIPRSPDFLNFRIPAASFNISLKLKSNLNLVVLTKVFPEMDWGDYDYSIEVYPADGRKSGNQDSGKKNVSIGDEINL
jgi:hypothetical protein